MRCLLDDGYDAAGIDISPEQVALAHLAGLGQVRHGDYRDLLRDRHCELAAVTATDLLEHLTKPEVLDTFDTVARALFRMNGKLPDDVLKAEPFSTTGPTPSFTLGHRR